MQKIEIVHNEAALNQIKKQCENHELIGFTTMAVHAAFGPLTGAYSEDETDALYYTFIVVPDAEADHLLSRLRAELNREKQLILISGVIVERPAFSH